MENRKLTVSCGVRSFSEIIDLVEERENFEDSEFPSPDMTWEHYIRPIETEDVDDLNGDHILFGWNECIFQSDYSPFMALTEFNESETWKYACEAV